MDAIRTERIGLLILRTYLALIVLVHGLSKVFGGIDFVIKVVTAHGLPALFAYGVYVGEVAAPLLLLIGLWVRPAAWVIAFNMIMAIYLVRAGQLLTITKAGGWAVELEGFILIAAVVVAITARPVRWERERDAPLADSRRAAS